MCVVSSFGGGWGRGGGVVVWFDLVHCFGCGVCVCVCGGGLGGEILLNALL